MPSCQWVDLTVPVATGMPVYPGDPEVAVGPALTVPADGVNVLRLRMGSQSGTHVDAPYHVDDAWPTLEELPLERFAGPAVVLDARGRAPGAPVGPGLLSPVRERLVPGAVLLVATGWSAHWGTPRYFHRHPWLAAATARAVVEAGVRTVGIDAPSVDRAVASDAPAAATEAAGTDASDPLPAHRILCGAGAVIAENLTGLEALLHAQEAGRPVEVSLFPLRLAAADGAPVRAVARIG